MSEFYPTDAELNALSGISDNEQEVLFITTGESPYYTSFYKMLYSLLKASRRAGDLRVYKDAALTFGVRAGKYFNGDAVVNYAGATAQALTNNQTNYIYLTAAGSLVVNITGFPVPSVTPHIPLATIVTAAGDYDCRDVSDGGDITDYRGRSIFQVCGGGASLHQLDWQESLADELDFTAAEPAAPTLGDRYLNTGSGASSVTGQTVAANDIEEWNGTDWTEITPTEGACALVEDRDMLIAFNGAAWVDIGTFALLAEAQAFFAATDISGAEAETLTDGSNADAKHVHTLASGITDVAATPAQLDEAGTFFAATDISGAEAETLSDGSNADSLHVHAVAGLAAAVQDLMPNLNLTGADDGDGTGSCTIQARDAANNNLAERCLVRTWISNTDYGIVNNVTDFSATTGSELYVLSADGYYEVISDASGTVVMNIDLGGAGTVYVMAEVDGRIYSSGAINITVP